MAFYGPHQIHSVRSNEDFWIGTVCDLCGRSKLNIENNKQILQIFVKASGCSEGAFEISEAQN